QRTNAAPVELRLRRSAADLVFSGLHSSTLFFSRKSFERTTQEQAVCPSTTIDTDPPPLLRQFFCKKNPGYALDANAPLGPVASVRSRLDFADNDQAIGDRPLGAIVRAVHHASATPEGR